MKRKILSGFLLLFLLFGMTGVSHAALEIIGTANYGPNEYNLIWQDDNNGQSLVWLDYSHTPSTWDNQNYWADVILGEVLILDIDPAYSVDWGTNSWRLPSAGTDPHSYYNTTSEMGYLYYTELNHAGGERLKNKGEFKNLNPFIYWTGTDSALYMEYAWQFDMGYYGDQIIQYRKSTNFYGLAVRTGQVSAVPVPGAIWLLGSGLLGLVGYSRRRTR